MDNWTPIWLNTFLYTMRFLYRFSIRGTRYFLRIGGIACCLWLMVITSAAGQSAYYLPRSPITVTAPNINVKAIEQGLGQGLPTFAAATVEQIKDSIRQSNAAIEEKLRSVESIINREKIDYTDLLAARDIPDIQKQIQLLKGSQQELRQTLNEELANTSHSGVFIAFVPVADSAANYQVAAHEAISKLATVSLNGVQIMRETTVNNMADINDLIQGISSGKLTVAEVLLARVIPATHTGIYCIKIKVAPLPDVNTHTLNPSHDSTELVVLDALHTPSLADQLTQSGLPAEDIQALQQKLQACSNAIEKENAAVLESQIAIVQHVHELMSEARESIAMYETVLQKRSRDLLLKTKDIPGMRFSVDQADSLVSFALRYKKQQIESATSAWEEAKSSELVVKEYPSPVKAKNKTAIAKCGNEVAQQLAQTYSMVTRTVQMIKVQNLMVTAAQHNMELEVYRDLGQVWLYPTVNEQEQALLTVVGKFNIHQRMVSKVESDEVLTPKGGVNAKHLYTIDNKDISLRMCKVKGGRFMMGVAASKDTVTDQSPAHEVKLRDFEISATEITVKQFRAFVQSTGYTPTTGKGGWAYAWDGISCRLMKGVDWQYDAAGQLQTNDEAPVLYISWYDAVAFCEWLSKTLGHRFRLPTEAEWEYAARGGAEAPANPIGDKQLPLSAWFSENADSRVHSVGSRMPNKLGLYDMVGNAWEWCGDDYDGSYYGRSAVDNPLCADGRTGKKVIRGGGWNAEASRCLPTVRDRGYPSVRMNYVGFRVVMGYE